MRWLILCAFIGGLIGAFVYQWISLFVRHRRRPRLEFQIRNEAPFIVAAMHNESPTIQATWIRVRIYNSGGRNAKSCRAYLMDLIKEGDKRDEVILKDEALTLWASNGGDDGINAPLTISRDFGRCFDIAYFLNRDEMKIPSSQYDLRTTAKLAPGVYSLGIAVSGANFDPITAKIEIRFDVENEPIVASFR
jgi:hypothetical protein